MGFEFEVYTQEISKKTGDLTETWHRERDFFVKWLLNGMADRLGSHTKHEKSMI